jgi:hypothetical protein
MARTYKRDSRGRFAGGGGGSSGGGSKGGGAKRGRPPGPSGGKTGTRTQQKKAAAAQADRTKQFSSKVAPNTAKEKYKAARSQVRELKMYRGGKTDATVKKAEARVARMEKSRKSSRARI